VSESTNNEAVREEIARRAYAKFCDRGCVHGRDTEDWLAAEREVLGEQQKPAEVPDSVQGSSLRQRARKNRR
jgi:hypothetical protein